MLLFQRGISRCKMPLFWLAQAAIMDSRPFDAFCCFFYFSKIILAGNTPRWRRRSWLSQALIFGRCIKILFSSFGSIKKLIKGLRFSRSDFVVFLAFISLLFAFYFLHFSCVFQVWLMSKKVVRLACESHLFNVSLFKGLITILIFYYIAHRLSTTAHYLYLKTKYA